MALKKAPKYKVLCPQGKTWRKIAGFYDTNGNTPNLAGYSAKAEIRTQLPTENSTAGDDDVLFTLSSDDDTITIIPEHGKLILYISKEDTASFPAGSYFWELELISPDGETPYTMAPSIFQVLQENTL